MNAYVNDLGYRSFAVKRVIDAFTQYSPDSINIVNNERDADIILIHVYGRFNRVKNRIKCLKKNKKKYVIIQYTLRGSLTPKTTDWIPLWEGASVVWSYLDLKNFIKEDEENSNFNFYYAPLGVDKKLFYPLEKDHTYQICSSGANYMTEGVRECCLASRDVGRRSAHLGIKINVDSVDSFINVDDETVTRVYNKSDYVAGLRRNEGFELPAAEGLLCGVRPVVFDSRHYRQWYDDLAIFIPETSRQDVIDNLKIIFKGELRPVTADEILEAEKRFNWKTLLTGFWERI